MTFARHQDSIAMVKEDTLEYKSMDLDEGRSHWWKEDTSIKDVKFTRSRWWRSNVCSIICVTLPLFLILMVLASLKFNEQASMLKELETKASYMESTLQSFQANLQQTAPHSQPPDYKELTEIKSEVTDLKTSIASLSSKLHGSDEKLTTTLTNLTGEMLSIKHSEVEKLVTTLTNLTAEIMSIKHSKDEKILTTLTNLTTEIMNIKSSKGKINHGCKENWRFHATSCYLFSLNKLSWHRARDYCRTQGASLVIMNSADEWEFIKLNSSPKTFWIGLTDELTGVWRWVDGTNYVMDKSQWDAGQPDDWKDHGLGGGEDCAHIKWNTKLNDDHCSSEYLYICEQSTAAD